MLHWLGGSSKTWTEVGERLSSGMTCVALDLPGFGCSVDAPDTGIDTTVDSVIETIVSLRVERNGPSLNMPWFIAGHSMGGKFAAIIARAAADGRPGLDNLGGLILVSPSPPGPEPMKEATRQQMIESLGASTRNAANDLVNAETFVDDNTGNLPLPQFARRRAVDDVLRMNRPAFTAWLTTGSKEDWAATVGVLSIPALILAGSKEPALGPEAQQKLTVPHFKTATLVTLEGGGHLGPLERPAELADRISAFIHTHGISQGPSTPLSADFQALIDSRLTSPKTRSVLLRRLVDGSTLDANDRLSPDDLLILQAAARRVIPGCPFDLAARVQSWLSQNNHDGWRHDSLPPVVTAWRIGLRSLDAAALREYAVPFCALPTDFQDQLLLNGREGRLGKGFLSSLHLDGDAALFSSAQMKLWFGDLCAELTRLYIADPRTMHRIGFTGFADEAGFTAIRLNEREDFEP